MDAIKEQMRKELEAKMKIDMSTEALDKAREEAEAAARSQLQVCVVRPSMYVLGKVWVLYTSLNRLLVEVGEAGEAYS